MHTKPYGSFVVLLFPFTTLVLWLLSKPYIGLIAETPYYSAGQLFAVLGATLLALTFCMTTNLWFLEDLFGGLDKVYKVHQLTGKTGFVFLVAHPTFLAAEALLGGIPFAQYRTIYITSPYSFGVLALIFLTTLIFITLYTKLKYETWRVTHRFMGLVLVFSILHMTMVHSDISRYLPLRYWLLSLMALATVSVSYRYIFYDLIPRKLIFTVDAVTPFGKIWEIVLSPARERLTHKPGQFVFVKFGSRDLAKQRHPFSISSYSGGEKLRLSIKQSGDFTADLKKVRPGDRVEVYGPYGRFTPNFMSAKEFVFIAGGIGVTPILSFVQYLAKNALAKKIYMIYSVATQNDLYREEELSKSGDNLPNYKYVRWVSAEKGMLTAEKVVSETGDVKNKQFYICGPLPMMKALSKQLLAKGVPASDIFYEDFSLR